MLLAKWNKKMDMQEKLAWFSLDAKHKRMKIKKKKSRIEI